MRVTAFPNASAARYWRLDDPFGYLRRHGLDAYVADGPITEAQIAASDAVVLHNCVDKEGIALIRAYQAEHGLKLIVEQDDWIEVDDSNPWLDIHKFKQAADVVRITLEIADLVTTTTQHLAGRLREINPNVAVLPNSLDLKRWSQPKLANDSDTVRIGWAGSITHLKDLELVAPALKRICAEFPQVRLVFMGDYRIRKMVEGLPAEVMLGVPFESYPQRLAGLRLDIGIAPLRDTPFNRCKSNIKFLEYSINKIPGVYSEIVYDMRGFDPDFGLIARTEGEWYRCLRNLVVSRNLRADVASRAHAFVRAKYNLERTGKLWLSAYRRLLT